jgi:hypothetical protein
MMPELIKRAELTERVFLGIAVIIPSNKQNWLNIMPANPIWAAMSECCVAKMIKINAA